MKKLMMLLATVCAVGIAQAAFVDWAINLGKDNYANKQYYVFGGSDKDAAIALLGAYDASTTPSALSDLALASGTLNAKAGKASGAGLDIGSNSSLYMVVLNDALAAGTTYIADTMNVSAYTYTPPATPDAGTFTANNASFTGSGTIVAGGGGGGTDPVPEPTSGLLLLVGASLLGLRRKRA